MLGLRKRSELREKVVRKEIAVIELCVAVAHLKLRHI